MELIIGCILIVLLLNYVSRNDMRNKKEKANANAMTYSERIAEDINSGITITNCMKQIIIRKDGTQVTVFDHGRIVENIYYGRVFYVLLLNEK